VVAFAWASNAVGTVTDARRVCQLAHDAGALAWVDAVHYAAHEPIDVRAIGADMLICSPYKFCGPHLGVRGRAVRGDEPVAAVQGAPRPPPARLGRSFETGTQSYELLAGFKRDHRLPRFDRGLRRDHPLRGARSASASSTACPTRVTVYGRPGMDGRVPTFLVNVDGVAAEEVCRAAGRRPRWGCGHTTRGTRSACYQRLGYTGKSVRIGFIHYNSPQEVDRLAEALSGLRLSPRPIRPGVTRRPRRGSRRACPG